MSLSVKADIYSAETVEEINNSLMEFLEKRNPEKTLVVLPLEDFFAVPTHPAFDATKEEEFRVLVARVSSKAKLSRRQYLGGLILTQYEQRFSDPLIPEFVKNLQKKNVPIMVVTRNFSGSLNKIPYLEVWTWKYLFDKGVDLSKSPIGSKQIMFNKKYKKIGGTYPTFYKGLLSCNSADGENSPQSIIAYLLSQELKWLPDVIYVVDKKKSYIQSLEQQFKSIRSDIQVEGFVYSPVVKNDIEISSGEFLKFWEGLVVK
ncbi:MAG: DUF2608 domain-containing protein, partial [Rickettsiaceae bacterium]|nr:DUF2608 domain-containing protein [Rickettsiaceae bacterium]